MNGLSLMSTSLTALLPFSVKLLSGALPPLTPRAMPIRSQARNTQAAATRTSNQARRHERQAPPMPCEPVREEQNVPRLFLDHRLERVDEFRRKIP